MKLCGLQQQNLEGAKSSNLGSSVELFMAMNLVNLSNIGHIHTFIHTCMYAPYGHTHSHKHHLANAHMHAHWNWGKHHSCGPNLDQYTAQLPTSYKWTNSTQKEGDLILHFPTYLTFSLCTPLHFPSQSKYQNIPKLNGPC